MSIAIGKKIRNIRESLNLGRGEFCEKTGINKGTLIGLEVNERGVNSDILIAIAKVWPEYAVYLLTDNTDVEQRNPEDEETAKELPNHATA